MPAAALALFGTSADPPTRGHQALLEGLLSRYGQVSTWASDNPMKQHGAPLKLRARLLGTLVQQLGDARLTLAQELSSKGRLHCISFTCRSVCCLLLFAGFRTAPTVCPH